MSLADRNRTNAIIADVILEDDELGRRLAEREPLEREPTIFLTRADQNAATSWVFFQ